MSVDIYSLLKAINIKNNVVQISGHKDDRTYVLYNITLYVVTNYSVMTI